MSLSLFICPPVLQFVLIQRDRSVRHRPHAVKVSLTHNSPTYLDEEYPVTIEVTNADDRTLEVVADILLQPSEIEGAGEHDSTTIN